MCHHPKQSIPGPWAVSLLSPASEQASEHTRAFQCACSLSLHPHRLPLSSPIHTHHFPYAAPAQEAFPVRDGHRRGTWCWGQWVGEPPGLLLWVGSGGRHGCRFSVESSSLTKCWWLPPSCRLQKDLDVSTVHLLQPNAGGFLCRQVGWKTLAFCCLNEAFFFPNKAYSFLSQQISSCLWKTKMLLWVCYQILPSNFHYSPFCFISETPPPLRL